MPVYKDVAALDQIRPGLVSRFSVATGAIAVFALDHRYYAISDLCLRCGASLAAGSLIGATIRCARCSWQYDLQTGAVDRIPGLRIQTFETEAANGHLRVATPT